MISLEHIIILFYHSFPLRVLWPLLADLATTLDCERALLNLCSLSCLCMLDIGNLSSSRLERKQKRGQCFSWRMHWATTALAVLHAMSLPSHSSHDENRALCRGHLQKKRKRERRRHLVLTFGLDRRLWLELSFVAGNRNGPCLKAISPSDISQPEPICVLCYSTGTVGDLLRGEQEYQNERREKKWCGAGWGRFGHVIGWS